jgi:hypothetical protein
MAMETMFSKANRVNYGYEALALWMDTGIDRKSTPSVLSMLGGYGANCSWGDPGIELKKCTSMNNIVERYLIIPFEVNP